MINDIFIKIFKNKWMFRSLPYTIYFNIHYLPLKQAIYLPIWLYKPRLLKQSGTIKIKTRNGIIKSGMIRIGPNAVSIYPNNGITIENRGTIIFKGSCYIGNNSYISIGPKSTVTFGEDFQATCNLKIASYNSIYFGNRVTVGWDCLFIDTDFHRLTRIDKKKVKPFGKIVIGNNNWFGNKCVIMKNTETNDFITIAATTLLNKSFLNIPQYSLIGNKKSVSVLAEGVWLNRYDQIIEY